MATYLFSYRIPNRPRTPDADSMAAWERWMGDLGNHILDPGKPVGEARVVGTGDGETRMGGYSLISADDLDHALKLAAGCPAIASGGGVEVGLLVEVADLAR